jgi:hypothetical protein
MSSEAPESVEAASALCADGLHEGVLYRSPVTGLHYAANVFVGVLVCGAIGALLGVAIPVFRLPVSGAWLGALFGALVAVGGAVLARRRGELQPLAIEVEPAARRVRIVPRRGSDLVLDAAAVEAVEPEAQGDEDAARVHALVFRGGGVELARVRVDDGAQAERLAHAIRNTLGLVSPVASRTE